MPGYYVAGYYLPEQAGSGQRGICVHCGLGPTKEGHDGCLGTLPGPVMNACCGHGNNQQAYIQYWDPNNRPGLIIKGQAAVEIQHWLLSTRNGEQL